MNELDIPININTLKLQDWLVSRRIVPKNIQVEIKEIRRKVSTAMQDIPSIDALIKLINNSNINYYQCKDIIEVLKLTEKDTKNMFGSYGSKRMKDWFEVLRLYEKDNIYLAEAAQIYVRNVNYEIPVIRKQITKLEQQNDECIKSIQDLYKPESQLLSQRETLLQQLGIKGVSLQIELANVLNELPEIYNNSIRNVVMLKSAVQFYSDCCAQKLSLPILKHIIDFGNTTVYQYLYKETPLVVEEPPIKINTIEQSGPNANIENSDIDFRGYKRKTDIYDNNKKQEDEHKSKENINLNTCSASIKTDYGIHADDNGETKCGIIKGDQAYTVLDSPTYRNRLINELYELASFLKIRLCELNQLEAFGNGMFSLMDNTSTHDAEHIRKMCQLVDETLDDISSEHVCHLFQLKHSPKYASLLVSKLKRMDKALDKVLAFKEVVRKRSIQLKLQRQKLNPILNELLVQTKVLQMFIAKDISSRYKNRIVNFIGGVN